ncbi:hypothetical protein DFJ74DRAFT_655959 [Hyaloraphidium curvatum]|nr:hypothetical protein DFJ74DRAFT_655959 [Hyaloraphidium curvatum]
MAGSAGPGDAAGSPTTDVPPISLSRSQGGEPDAANMASSSATLPMSSSLEGGLEDSELFLPFSLEDTAALTGEQLSCIPDPFRKSRPSGRGKGRGTLTGTFKAMVHTLVDPADEADDDDETPEIGLPRDCGNDKLLVSMPTSEAAAIELAAHDGLYASDAVPLEAVSVDPSAPPPGSPWRDDFQWAPLLAHMQLRRITRLKSGHAEAPASNLPLLLLLGVIALLFAIFTLAERFADLELSRALYLEIWTWILMCLVLLPGLFVIRFTLPPAVQLTWFWISMGYVCCLIMWLDAAVKVGRLYIGDNVCANDGNAGNGDEAESDACVAAVTGYISTASIGISVFVAISGTLAICTITIYLLRNLIFPFLLKHYANRPGFVRVFLSVRPMPTPFATWMCSYRLPFPLSVASKRHTFRYSGETSTDGLASGHGKVSDSAPQGEMLEGWFEGGIPVAPYISQERSRFNAFEAVRVGTGGATGCGDKFMKSGSWRDPKGISWGVAMIECSAAGRFFRNLPSITLGLRPSLPSGTHETHLRETIIPFLRTGLRHLVTDPGAGDGRDAIIYIHGLKQSLGNSAAKLAQFVILAAFPATKYALWCFDWPGGSVFSFNRTREESGSEQTERELEEFLRALIGAGYRRFHIIAHSMGTRVTTNLARHGGGALSRLFKERDDSSTGYLEVRSDAPKAELVSVILINPEIVLNDFVYNRFPSLHRFCKSITIYADRNDRALLTAETLGGEATLGRSPHLVLCRDALGRPRYLDCDVIDNTHLEANINVIRHAYFALNPMLVDDIKGIIDDGLCRARDRSSLRRKGGNVFGFLVAPSSAV